MSQVGNPSAVGKQSQRALWLVAAVLDPLPLQVQQNRAFSFYDIHRAYLRHMI